jgi:hypothetical protein
MADRIKLNLVGDPVGGQTRTSPGGAKAESKLERRERPPSRRSKPNGSKQAPGRTDQSSGPPDSVPRYAGEEKRAVFGRVPRSLNRRLERAVVELRDEFEDLTQEQVLAALLHENVDPADPALLVELAESVQRYRRELGRA